MVYAYLPSLWFPQYKQPQRYQKQLKFFSKNPSVYFVGYRFKTDSKTKLIAYKHCTRTIFYSCQRIIDYLIES